MGRQFQLETIPRFQWRVIVEVCSGLAQTKLDSTNFWVIECDVRFGVKSAVLTVGQSLPIYPIFTFDNRHQWSPDSDTTARFALAGHLGQSRKRSGTFNDRHDARAPKRAYCRYQSLVLYLLATRGSLVIRGISLAVPSGSGKVARMTRS